MSGSSPAATTAGRRGPNSMSTATDLLVKQFWPTTICSRMWTEHRREAADIIEFLYQLKAKETAAIASGVAPGAKSAVGLFESNFNLFTVEHAGLNKLKAFIGQTV